MSRLLAPVNISGVLPTGPVLVVIDDEWVQIPDLANRIGQGRNARYRYASS